MAPTHPASDAEAARFLAQAGFAASLADIATVKAVGYAGWLEQQFATAPGPSNWDWMVANGYAVAANIASFKGVDYTLWRQLFSAPDVLRQRVMLALSEIFVVSMGDVGGNFRGMATAAYADLLAAHAFGSFRELLEAVALSPAMGTYLDMLGSKKPNGKGSQPDENFAREVMQLMSIGLVQLNLDGSPKRDAAGNPLPTYQLDDVTSLAAVFTGWTYDGLSSTDPACVQRPMVNVAANFASGPKQVLGADVPAALDGPAAMKLALDTLAAHPNVGPFIGRQLIQRLVGSNPSVAYVKRVAQAFNDNGAGQRGDMKAVVKAVLLDAEARILDAASPSAGKLREPVLRFVQWGRTFGLRSPTGLWNVPDTSNPATALGQSPLRSPSVFNFFRPGYVPPNTTMATQQLTAPEFQLCNEVTLVAYLNFMQNRITSGIGELVPDYTAELALAGDAAALVEHVALLMAAGALSAASRATIAGAVGTIAATTDAGRLKRVQATIYLVMASPEYLVQK